MTMRLAARGNTVVRQRAFAQRVGDNVAGSFEVQTLLRDGLVAHGGSVVVRGLYDPIADISPVRAIVASKKVGSAVLRNRAKRRIREALRGAGIPHGMDVVVVARGNALTTPLPVLQEEITTLLARLHPRAMDHFEETTGYSR